MSEKLNKICIIGLLILLVCAGTASSFILLFGSANDSMACNECDPLENAEVSDAFGDVESTEGTRANTRDGVKGPMELLNNSDISQVSDWVFVNGTRMKLVPNPLDLRVEVGYDNPTAPTKIKVENWQPLDLTETPISPPLMGRFNQTFNKPIWTSTAPNSVICSFDYEAWLYDGLINGIGNPGIYADIILEIKNTASGTWGVWPIEQDGTPIYGNGSIKTGDPRVNHPPNQVPQFITEDIASGPTGGSFPAGSTFDLSPPGTYELSIIFQYWSDTSGFSAACDFKIVFDNVSLSIMDAKVPEVYNKNNITTFGPYNNDTYDDEPLGMIDIDFDAGAGMATPLDEGKYRLNNSGTPNDWQQIFKIKEMDYKQNWSISQEWANLAEGRNNLDIYCNDHAGNYNDSVHITVIKDTRKPISKANVSEEYYTTEEFDVYFTASDPGLTDNPVTSGGFDNTVKLEVRYNGQDPINYTTPSNPNGSFTTSPIKFNITHLGTGYGEGKYELSTIAFDNASNIEDPPSVPDITIAIDLNLPSSEVLPLASTINVDTFDIKYTASDSASGIHHVELWYYYQDEWRKWHDTNHLDGNFTESPISFTAANDGDYEFYSVAYDNASHIEEFGIPGSTTESDTYTTVDSRPPHPKFIKPERKHISGKNTIAVKSDEDTQYVEFYYWIDLDKDGSAVDIDGVADDPDDINSSWKLIEKVTEPSEDMPVNWSTEWNTDAGTDFDTEELMVVLKAVATDNGDKVGYNTTNDTEVDNIAPVVTITNPVPLSPENGAFININYTTDPDVMFATFYYRIHGDTEWINIIDKADHTYGDTLGTFQWELPIEFRNSRPVIDIRVEAIDDALNTGTGDVEEVPINQQGPHIDNGFTKEINWEEDFGRLVQQLSLYESHPNIKSPSDDLKWYVTGNSKQLFHITGDNSTGINSDTFVFNSIANRHGNETLTFHLHDPNGIEAIVEQTIIVHPDNDEPVLALPEDPIHVVYGEPDTFDLSYFIYDVDNKISELTLNTDDQDHITVNMLSLTFNYDESMDGETKTILLTVRDLEDSASGALRVYISDNHRPKLIQNFPTDLELESGHIEENYLDLDEHFDDMEDDDELTFSWEIIKYVDEDDMVFIDIDPITNEVTFEAVANVEGEVTIRFTAKDPLGAWGVGHMTITITDVPDSPRIKPIPDINVHYYNPDSTTDYEGYGYDFSYFVYDPDTDRSELIIWAKSTMDGDNDAWVQPDPKNNMRLIFKFPFTAVGKHTLVLYAQDRDQGTEMAYRHFNVTVIIDAWPVEYIGTIPEQSFLEDVVKEDAFRMDDYFNDRDGQAGGTDYSIVEQPGAKVNAVIDEYNNVTLSSNKQNWNGEEEVVILAMDTNPVQYVYAIFNVIVIPVNDPPTIDNIPVINVTVKKEESFNLKDYIHDIDTKFEYLEIISGDTVHVEVTDQWLTIRYDKAGKYTVLIEVVDIDKSKASTTITINVQAPPTEEERIPEWLIYAIVMAIIVVILVILFIAIVMTRYKVLEIFLIHQSGILLTHLSHDHEQQRDDEILSGMFTAVQEFIKDSFSGSASGEPVGSGEDYVLKEMKIGDNKNILIERGKYVYLAVIFSGRGANKLRSRIKNTLNSIETQYELPFKTWVGDMDKIAGVENLLQPLIPEGGKPVMVDDKALGRVPAPAVSPGPTPTPTPTAPQPTPQAPIPTPTPIPISVKPKPAVVTPIKPVQPVKPMAPSPSPRVPAPVPVSVPTPSPAPAIMGAPATPKPAIMPTSARPATATVQPAVAKPATAATAILGAPKCPKCGASAQKFPDGSLLCTKCGYTGK